MYVSFREEGGLTIGIEDQTLRTLVMLIEGRVAGTMADVPIMKKGGPDSPDVPSKPDSETEFGADLDLLQELCTPEMTAMADELIDKLRAGSVITAVDLMADYEIDYNLAVRVVEALQSPKWKQGVLTVKPAVIEEVFMSPTDVVSPRLAKRQSLGLDSITAGGSHRGSMTAVMGTPAPKFVFKSGAYMVDTMEQTNDVIIITEHWYRICFTKKRKRSSRQRRSMTMERSDEERSDYLMNHIPVLPFDVCKLVSDFTYDINIKGRIGTPIHSDFV